jgi:serine/threonine-protein kinase
MKRLSGKKALVALVAAVFAGCVWLGALPAPVAAADKAAKKPLEIQAAPAAEEKDAFIVITAEGLADPNADAYKRDKALMIEDLRRDAKSQILEKAVGAYVETSTLVENYTLISDRVLSRSQGLIKRVIKESEPWIGEDGFAHMLMKAEVSVVPITEALAEMSRGERVALLKEYGNPRVSVAIFIRDAERGPEVVTERSEIAENVLKEHIKSFGYRVWSDEHVDQLKARFEKKTDGNAVEATLTASAPKAADFSIMGEAKFKTVSAKLPASGLTVTKYVLTSWSVKCMDNHTGEEIYFNNQVPKKQSWADEDQAIEEIGRLIGGEFSREFFEEHLQAPSKMFQLEVAGLPSYDLGQLLRKEFIGLRPVLNIDFREFDKTGLSLYEVEFTGSRGNFNDLLVSAIIEPLNQKVGQGAFSLESAKGNVVRLKYAASLDAAALTEKLNTVAPAALGTAAPARLKEIIKSEETMQKVAEVSPEIVKKLSEEPQPGSKTGLDAVKNF